MQTLQRTWFAHLFAFPLPLEHAPKVLYVVVIDRINVMARGQFWMRHLTDIPVHRVDALWVSNMLHAKSGSSVSTLPTPSALM